MAHMSLGELTKMGTHGYPNMRMGSKRSPYIGVPLQNMSSRVLPVSGWPPRAHHAARIAVRMVCAALAAGHAPASLMLPGLNLGP